MNAAFRKNGGNAIFTAGGALIFFALLFSAPALAATVNVNIYDLISSELKESHAVSSGLLSSRCEIYNSGSVPYSSRIRLAVYNGTEEFFSAWGTAEAIMPGERKESHLFAYVPSAGFFTAKLFGHYANDAFELGEYNFSKGEDKAPARAIILSKPTVYDDKVTVSVSAKAGESGIIVMPSGYPKTWVFGQKYVSFISAGKAVRIEIPYHADVFLENQVSLIAVSADGNAFGTISFSMKRERGMHKYISILNDWIMGAG